MGGVGVYLVPVSFSAFPNCQSAFECRNACDVLAEYQSVHTVSSLQRTQRLKVAKVTNHVVGPQESPALPEHLWPHARCTIPGLIQTLKGSLEAEGSGQQGFPSDFAVFEFQQSSG